MTVKFFVEVCTKLTDASTAITRKPARDWNDSLRLSQQMAAEMFYEDPMATRVFRSGIPVYMNTNDMGDHVTIRPTVESADEEMVPVNKHECNLAAEVERDLERINQKIDLIAQWSKFLEPSTYDRGPHRSDDRGDEFV
jgi:hypothetical protein